MKMNKWERCVEFHGHSCGEKTGANWLRLAGEKKLCLDCYESCNRFDV